MRHPAVSEARRSMSPIGSECEMNMTLSASLSDMLSLSTSTTPKAPKAPKVADRVAGLEVGLANLQAMMAAFMAAQQATPTVAPVVAQQATPTVAPTVRRPAAPIAAAPTPAPKGRAIVVPTTASKAVAKATKATGDWTPEPFTLALGGGGFMMSVPDGWTPPGETNPVSETNPPKNGVLVPVNKRSYVNRDGEVVPAETRWYLASGQWKRNPETGGRGQPVKPGWRVFRLSRYDVAADGTATRHVASE